MSYSGLFDGHYGTPHTLLADNKQNLQVRLSRLVARRQGNRRDRELLDTLIGAAPGNSADASYTRVNAPDGLTDNTDLGGLRTIDTVSVINRVTTSADVDALKEDINQVFAPEPYVADASGNGGSGKLDEGL